MEPSYRFDTSNLVWTHFEGSARFDYPIAYRVAVLGHQKDLGLMDLIIEWAPNSYCELHRHVAATATLVLEGEHHVIDIDEDGTEIGHTVRPAGDYRTSPGGDLHKELGGPAGSTVLFHLYEPGGRMFDVLDDNLNLLATSTIQGLVKTDQETRAARSPH
jgi:hypothetical protein